MINSHFHMKVYCSIKRLLQNAALKSSVTASFFFLFIGYSFASINLFSNSDSAAFYIAKAKQSKIERKLFDVEKYLLKALEFDAKDENILFELANYYAEQKKFTSASTYYSAVIKINDKNIEAYKKIIELSLQYRKWNDVIKHGEEASAKQIKVPNLSFMLGKAYYEIEDYGKARKNLITQHTSYPEHKETIVLLGRTFVEFSLYAEAIEMYLKALALNANNPELLYETAILYSSRNNDKEAVKYFLLAAEKGIKQDLAFLENLGMAYLNVDLYKGVEVLNKVLEKKPGDNTILTQIAQAYYNYNQFENAYNLYMKVFENDPKNIKAYYMAGVSLIRKGDKGRGSQICDKAISLDPKLSELKTQRSIL